ncbi:MAG: T9SS type A sorting domain-containing protein [Bacteroidota bacterium]
MRYVLLFLTIPALQSTFGQALYPYGNEFPLGLYALYNSYDVVSADHWNCGHTYQEAPTSDDYFATCAANGLQAMARLSYLDSIGEKWSRSESVIAQEIMQQATQANLAWWDLPEELRYWYSNEFEIVQDYTAWTRQYDPLRRPTYMYIPGHYDVGGVEPYVPYLDILPASCYPQWQEWPHAYVRWSVERTQQAVAEQGYTLGDNYLADEKTVMAILELFEGDLSLTAAGTWHDFWLALACEAKGVLVFSHFYRNSSPSLSRSWDTLNAATTIFNRENLGQVLLQGQSVPVQVDLIEGAQLTPSFTVDTEAIQYEAVKVLAQQWQDTTYVIAVNSAEATTTFSLTGLPALTNAYTDVFSSTSYTFNGTNLTAELPALGVGVYKFYPGVTSTTNSFATQKYRLSSNPFTEELTILNAAPGLTLQLFTSDGKALSAAGLFDQYTLRGNQLARGVYLLRIYDPVTGAVETHKVIKR